MAQAGVPARHNLKCRPRNSGREFVAPPEHGAGKRKSRPRKGRLKRNSKLSNFLLCSAEGAFAHDPIAVMAQLLLELVPAWSVIRVQRLIQVGMLFRFRHGINFVDTRLFETFYIGYA